MQSLSWTSSAGESQDLQSDCASSSSSSSTTATSQESPTSLLNPNTSMDEHDGPAISLLSQIFPEESPNSLRQLHHDRIRSAASTTAILSAASSLSEGELRRIHTQGSSASDCGASNSIRTPNSALGRRIFHQHMLSSPDSSVWPNVDLPNEFLRLPISVAVRRTKPPSVPPSSESNTKQYPRYELISDLHHQALQEYFLLPQPHHSVSPYFYTTAIIPHPEIGLGLKLSEDPELNPNIQNSTMTSQLFVHELVDHPENPCDRIGSIMPGDVLLGINGSALFFAPSSTPRTRMQHAVHTIRDSPHPIVLHFGRFPAVQGNRKSFLHLERNSSLFDSSQLDTASTLYSPTTRDPSLAEITAQNEKQTARSYVQNTAIPFTQDIPHSQSRTIASTNILSDASLQEEQAIHPFAVALRRRGLIASTAHVGNRSRRPGFFFGQQKRSHDDAIQITQHLKQFNTRARQWEGSHSLLLNAASYDVLEQFNPQDLPLDMATLILTDFESSNSVYSSQQSLCPPSTTPLALDSAIIPLEYKKAFYGNEKVPSAITRSSRRTSPEQKSTNRWLSYPGNNEPARTHRSPHRKAVLLPLFNVRKGLCTRIVNTFFLSEKGDGHRKTPQVAYTIWVYDVSTNKEWYAPVRCLDDFEELRLACIKLSPDSLNIEDWDFPQATFRSGAGTFLSSLVQNAGASVMTTPLRLSQKNSTSRVMKQLQTVTITKHCTPLLLTKATGSAWSVKPFENKLKLKYTFLFEV